MDLTDITKNLIQSYEDIQYLKNKLKDLEKNKKKYEEILLNKLSKDTDIETKQYTISCNEKKKYQTFSKNYLEDTLNNYFKENTYKNNNSIDVKSITDYLYNSRKVSFKNEITIKLKNK